MSLQPLSYKQVLQMANLWREIGGSPEVEIGALEPLLWRDGNLKINDLVFGLTSAGFRVNLTTNGQLLHLFAPKLADANLSLLRTSWHTTSPDMFKELSGGYGNYERFYRGLELAAESGLNISFNRVLLRGFSDDLGEQLGFAQKHGSRIKLFTLMWTPEGDDTYQRFYQDWRPIVRKNVLPLTSNIVRLDSAVGRKRLKFLLGTRGSVEIKMGDILNRTRSPCASCAFKKNCEEGFGDYVRIDPRALMYFCYMRRDLGFQIEQYYGKPSDLLSQLESVFAGVEIDKVLASSSLRFTVTPVCNFNCRSPGTNHSWCMEEPGDYSYPKIKPSVLDDIHERKYQEKAKM